MLDRKGRSQFARPVWFQSFDQDVPGKPLQRLTFSSKNGLDDPQYGESWLQHLLYRYPEALPVAELEPAIGALVPIGLEMPTPAGFVDNVFVTASGNIVLVECKLWRNPEARRRVIAQIIDYAQSISRWRYEELDAAVRKSVDVEARPMGRSLIELVGGAFGQQDGLDEQIFVDATQRNLRLGRMLLLVAGDGIREDTESLAEFLQMHAGFHFTLALVEIAIFSGPGIGFVVQPRVLARTLNIERAVIRIASDSIIVEPPGDKGKPPIRETLSEELFFEQLEKAAPDTVAQLRDFRTEAANIGVFLDPATKSASFKWESPQAKILSLGGIDISGNFFSYNVSWTPESLGKVDLAHDYLAALSRILGGSVRQTPSPGQWYVVKSGRTLPPASDLLQKRDEWLAAIRTYQTRFSESDES